MRREKLVFTCLLVIVLSGLPAQAADDVQVIRSQKSVLSIYSYGGAAPLRLSPELPDRKGPGTRFTGSLTDVVSTPPLSTSVPVRSTVSKSASMTNSTTAPAKTSSMTTTTSPSGNGVQTADTGASAPATAGAPTVTVVWDPSPDQSVVGYQLYTGTASHQYTAKQPIGGQTSAQLVLDQPAIYVAVSAYTSDGLESALSEELVVTLESPQNASTTGLAGTRQ